MTYRIIGLLLIAVLATQTALASSTSTVDIVVIGKLKHLDYEHIYDENDLLGHGWCTANLRVKKVLTGQEKRRRLKVRYYGHNCMRDDTYFRFWLRRTETVDYLICAEPGSAGIKCD
jgi:hypothetical protein